MLPGQADGKAFSIRINAFTLVDVKQPEVCKPFACIVTNYFKHRTRSHITSCDQRQVTTGFRELGEFAELRQAAFDHVTEHQLEDEHRAVQVQGLGELWVQGAEVADFLAVAFDAGSLAWVQGVVFARDEGEVAQGSGNPAGLPRQP